MGSKVLEVVTVDIRREISGGDRKVIRDGSEGLQECHGASMVTITIT